MPRRPTRRGKLQKTPPSFSRFARAMALATSVHKVKQLNDNSTNRKVPSNSSGINVLDNKLHNGSRMKKNNVMEAKREEPDSSSEDKSTSEDESSSEGVVQADFVFFDPKPDDFHGVKVLLQTYLDNKVWDLSGFVDLILQQVTVGTIIKIEEDEDEGVYGFVTALNLQRYKDHICMTELKEFLLTACKDNGTQDSLRSYLGEKAADVGLLVSQRVVNLPPQLLPPMYDGLFDEVSWATEDEPTKELRKSFCFKHYLLVSKVYKHKNGEQKKKGSSSSEEDIIYIKPEDEILHKLSAWSFCFPLRTQEITTNELKNYRSMGLVMAVDASRVPTFREQLHALIEEP